MPVVASFTVYAKETASPATRKTRELFFVTRHTPALAPARPLLFTMYIPLPPLPHPRRFCLLFAAGGPCVASRTRTPKPARRNPPRQRHKRGPTGKAVKQTLSCCLQVCESVCVG